MSGPPENALSAKKQEIRERVWSLMEREGVARFPRPIWGRIPNFAGAAEAAQRLCAVPIFVDARVVKVNPDAPQRLVRENVLRQQKQLLVPTPRLRNGFLLINPVEQRGMDLGYASTIRGASRYGKPVGLGDIPKVDLIVAGSVAVSTSGVRVGKGGGYSEIEYGILRELQLVDDRTPVVTTAHELQVVEDVPLDRHDLIVDKIMTPVRIIDTGRKEYRPQGIFWDKVTDKMLEQIPVLKDLAKLDRSGTLSNPLVATRLQECESRPVHHHATLRQANLLGSEISPRSVVSSWHVLIIESMRRGCRVSLQCEHRHRKVPSGSAAHSSGSTSTHLSSRGVDRQEVEDYG